MKTSRILSPLIAPLFGFVAAAHGAVIYSEDFSSVAVTQQPIGFIGGFYSSQVAAEQWYSANADTSIITGELSVSSSSEIRSAAIYLPESLFSPTGAGEYRLTFDVISFVNPGTNGGVVRVWNGNGIGAPDEPESLILRPLDATLGTFGSSTSNQVGELTFNAAGDGMEIAFNYSGSGVVALFFGADTNPPEPVPLGWPFPVIHYDNISIAAVPEPSSALLGGLAGMAFCLSRRRR